MTSPIVTIQHDDSLDSVWQELVYSEARCLKDVNAKDLAPHFTVLIERCEAVRGGQLKAWRAEIVAQAGVDAADDALDDDVEDLHTDLVHIERNVRTARYKMYFPRPKGEIVRLGLESELGKVRTWPAALQAEPEKVLQDHGAKLAIDIEAGDVAIKGRQTSAGERALHRVKEIVTLIDDVNAMRRSVYGTLVTRASELKLGLDWPTRFFRRAARSARAKKDAAPSEPQKSPE